MLKNSKNWFYASVILYFVSLGLAKIDIFFIFRWETFWLHIASVAIIAFLYIRSFDIKHIAKKIKKPAEINPLILILIASEILNLIFIKTYPFVSLADELRDGGLYAMRIADGSIRNIFGYGAYDAHGLIIPTFAALFYKFFGPSVLTYRVPAALLSTADVFLTYLTIRLYLNKKAAFWSALILATLPLHLFFARTQIVVAFNFFWTAAILLSLLVLARRQRSIDYVFLGTLIGFTSGFHAAVRALAVIVFIIALFVSAKHLIKFNPERVKKFFQNIFLLSLFALVGFGPRLLFTTPRDFFHTSRFVLEKNLNTGASLTINDAQNIVSNYVYSLGVYFIEPTQFFYQDRNPILSPVLAVFFLAGIYYALRFRKKYLIILLSLLFILPFFNSAITDYVNADHRISPLFAIVAIFAGIGIYAVTELIKPGRFKKIAFFLLLIYLAYQTSMFFINQPANKKIEVKDYLSMHALYLLQQTPKEWAGSICFYVSPANQKYYFNNPAILEQQLYLTPGSQIQYADSKGINDNEAYVLKGACPEDYKNVTKKYEVECSQTPFECPLGDLGKITIYY